MKKNILYVLAVSMLLSCITVFAEDDQLEFKPGQEYEGGIQYESDEVVYTDTQSGIYYADISDYSSVGILGALDIMVEAEPGKFKPNIYVSRAEFVEGILRLMRIDYENIKVNPTRKFYDVDETHEKYSVIYRAFDSGLISGYGDNSFKPDRTIAYSEAIGCMVRALGYGEFSDYMDIASTIGLTKNIRVNNSQAITRIEMAEMLERMLMTPTCNMHLSGSGPSYTTDGKIPLSLYWNAFCNEGIVESNHIAGLKNCQYSDGHIAINSTIYKVPNSSYYNLLGYLVNYYYDEEDNLIYAYKDKKVEELVISADSYMGFDPSSRVINYCDEKDRMKKVKLVSGYDVLYNGVDISETYTTDIFDIGQGNIKVISNDGGSTYSLVNIEEYFNYYLNKATVSGRNVDFYLENDLGNFRITEDTYIEVYDENGAYCEVYRETETGESAIDVSAIKKDCIISVFLEYNRLEQQGTIKTPKSNTRYMKVIVSTDTVNGKVSDKDSQERTLTIGEKLYKIASNPSFDVNLLEFNREKMFALDYQGQVFAIKEDDGEWKYVYLVKPRFDEFEELVKMKVYTTAGKIEDYLVADGYKLNGRKVKKDGRIKGLLTASAQMIKPSFTYQQLIKIILNDNDEIAEIQTVTASKGVDSNYSEDWLQRDADTSEYYIYMDSSGFLGNGNGDQKGLYFQPNVFFTVPEQEVYDREYFSTQKYRTSGGAKYKIDVYDVQDLTPSVAVMYKATATDEAIITGYGQVKAPVMLCSKKVSLNDDDELVMEFKVAQLGTVKSYFSYNLDILDGYNKGELINLYGYGDEVTKITPVLYNGEHLGPDNLPDVDSTDTIRLTNYMDGYVYAFEVYKIVSSDKFILQHGSSVGNKREQQVTGYIRNQEWQSGGVLLYQEDDDGTISIRQGTMADLRSVLEHGRNRASIIIGKFQETGGRQYVIYNLNR